MKMSVRDNASFLDKVKKALMIPLEDTYADDEINLHIASCKVLLGSAGIPDELCNSDNGLVEGLILIYVKTFFGFKNDGTVRELPANFEILLRQLALSIKEESDVS